MNIEYRVISCEIYGRRFGGTTLFYYFIFRVSRTVRRSTIVVYMCFCFYVRMRFCVCRIASSNGFIVHALDCTGVSMEYWWKHNCKENTEVAGQKPVPLRHYPLPFPRWLLWTQTYVSLLICYQLASPVAWKRWTSSTFAHLWSLTWRLLWPGTGWSCGSISLVISVIQSKGSTQNWDARSGVQKFPARPTF